MDDTTLPGWQTLTDVAAELGRRLGGPDFPSDDADRAEGFVHLAGQLNCWVGWSVLHADPRRPRFQRQNDLVTPWGGPNADNVYRHARISPARRYRISGRMHSCEEFMLAIRAGFMHEETWGTVFETSATDLGIGEGAEFSFTLGNAADDDIPLPDGAVMVTFREYYYDWRALEPATITIECLDDDADSPRERLATADVSDDLRRAAVGLTHSIEGWNRYMAEHRAAAIDNEFAEVKKIAKGLDAARYRFCFWNLQPDEALVVTASVPQSRYWSLQLYNMAWFDLLEPTERQISLNHRQAAIDSDGLVRVVVAHRDPGVANWLDAGGREVGLLTLRWFWPDGEDPMVDSGVVPVADVASVLAETSPAVSAEQRLAALRARRAHLAWRFRT